MNSKIAIVLLVIITATGACKKEDKNDCIQGNGDIRQETRDVGEYNTVSASGAFNITFAQTSISQVDLFGDSNILLIIKTTVANKNLNISTDGSTCYTTNNTVEITLSSPLITRLTLDGSGKIVGNGLNQDDLFYQTNGAAVINSSFTVKNFEYHSNGSGNASYGGTAETAILTIIGTGSIFASTLITDKCTVTISGAGDVRIHVDEELNVIISGTGSVYYSGNPSTINTNITGSGQLIKEG